MAVDPDRLLTYEDLLAFPDDNIRREIIEGELFVAPAPRIRHQRLVTYLTVELVNFVRANPGGEAFGSAVDFRLSKHDVVEPDVVFIGPDRMEILEEKYAVGPPSLIMEVISDSKHDRVRKRALYERAGVPEYWIVDPETDRVEVFRFGGETYGRVEIFESGDTLESSVLPGFSIDITTLFDR